MLKKALLAGIAALIASLLFGGCFLMRTLTYTKDKVDPGQKSTAKISVLGSTGVMKDSFKFGDLASSPAKGGSDDEIPFFLMLTEGSDTKLTNGGKFDTKGAFSGPKDLKVNGALLDAAGEDCATTVPFKQQGPTPTEDASVVATKKPFDAHNERKLISVKLPIKTDPTASGGVLYGLFMGTWFDDGDQIPEDPDSTDDEYQCQPPYMSTLSLTGPINP